MRSERGAATVFVIGMSSLLIACAGLVADGGNAINERMRLADTAEQAARAGADAVDPVALRESGIVMLDPVAAESRVYAYLAGVGYGSGNVVSVDVTNNATEVKVVLTDRVSTILLGAVNIDEFEINATATAGAQQG